MSAGIFKVLKSLNIQEENTSSPKKLSITPGGTSNTSTELVSSQTANRTITLPDATDTIVGRNTTDTLTNKTLTTPTTDIVTLDGQGSTPSTPSAGNYKIYVKDSTGRLNVLKPSGLEEELAAIDQIPGGDFGDGSDGDITISSGITSLQRDMYYNNLTIDGTGSINGNGFKVYVKETLDLTNAPLNAINRNGSNGNNGGASLGVGGTQNLSLVLGGNPAGGSGVNGTINANGTQAAAPTNTLIGNGGTPGGAGGAGGAGDGTIGGASRNGGITSTPILYRRYVVDFIRGISQVQGGASAAGGSSGGGDATLAGRAGGGGGSAGAMVAVYAKIINRDSSTTASGAISVVGGNGGNGGTASSGNIGGGGAGGGGAGGYAYIAFEQLLGSAKTDLVLATGGTGGTGGNGFGTGIGGTGGTGGAGGNIFAYNVSTRQSYSTSGSAASSPTVATTSSGTAGTTGGSAALTL